LDKPRCQLEARWPTHLAHSARSIVGPKQQIGASPAMDLLNTSRRVSAKHRKQAVPPSLPGENKHVPQENVEVSRVWKCSNVLIISISGVVQKLNKIHKNEARVRAVCRHLFVDGSIETEPPILHG